jgi:hypothetical protein
METCRYRLTEARGKRSGWTAEQCLPAARYHAWSESVLTVDEVDVNAALEGFYVWADQENGRMAERERSSEDSSGVSRFAFNVLLGKELQEGISRVTNAQEHLKARMAQLQRRR